VSCGDRQIENIQGQGGDREENRGARLGRRATSQIYEQI